MSPESNGLKALGCMRDCIADGVRTRKLRKVDPDVAARATWAAIHGITSLLITHKSFPWGDRKVVIGATIDAVVDGLRRR